MMHKPLLFLTLLCALAPAVNATQREPATLRVVIVGDSTVADYPDNDPKRGWGQMLPAYLADNVEVVNLAIPGATSKTFLASSNWPQAVAPGGGYLLIQFGHNDGKLGKHPGAVEADGAFSDNLRLMIDAARAAGMQSVLVTPMHRVKYESDGKLTTELDPYVNAMKTVAAEKQVPLIDLNASSAQLFLELGETDAHQLNATTGDRVHFNAKGADILSKQVATGLGQVNPSLCK